MVSSSNMDDGAKLPRTNLFASFFDFKRSSAIGFTGSAGSAFFRPDQKYVRRWTHGIVKEDEMWEEFSSVAIRVPG
jgi:hypothetical protein